MAFGERNPQVSSTGEKLQEKKPGILGKLFGARKSVEDRKVVLKGDQQKNRDENEASQILKEFDGPTSNTEKAREKTEQGRVFGKDFLNKITTSPGNQKILANVYKYIGVNEKTQPDQIAKFHESAGQRGSDKDTAWCMSFVQHILKESGNPNYKPTAWARDGLTLGKATNSPQPGDLLIVERGTGGHIGFFVGYSPSGLPLIIGGNQGAGEVSIKEETRPILGYRSIA